MEKSEKQPVEVVTEKGQSIPIYYTPETKGGKIYHSYTFAYIQSGQRRRRSMCTLDKARNAAVGIARQLAAGTGHVVSLTPGEIADHNAAVKILRKHPGVELSQAVAEWSTARAALGTYGTLSDAVSMFLKAATERQLATITVPDLVKDFITAKENEGLSTAYLSDVSRRLKLFAGSFRVSVRSVTTSDISVWLRSLRATGRNFNNYRNAVCTLFSFARERAYLPRQEKTEAELLGRSKEKVSAIGIFTPSEIEKILASAPAGLVPAVAIGAFAGCRMMEILRMDWKQVHLDRGHIEILADNAKTAQRRLVPISANLAAWLAPHAQQEGRVSPPVQNLANLSRAVSKACRDAGVDMQINGLRHSYASYRLAVVKSADQVALEMGNSPRKLFANYRELVTEAEAAAWFAVMPPGAPENVISIGVAA